ncbi:hypothetical protein GJ629_14320 [Halapricum sp. CBA1109]|uniref:hypothetical protein n=1 Tax=Halapricum sp. CBA1109 TaxID=2668068 RepID=UPI0012F953CA|nr:hypothetical protein [Halapricum sp. CBA1109]MUV90922.1 hypothetical protein [Halapricum sp. CBA1109]
MTVAVGGVVFECTLDVTELWMPYSPNTSHATENTTPSSANTIATFVSVSIDTKTYGPGRRKATVTVAIAATVGRD